MTSVLPWAYGGLSNGVVEISRDAAAHANCTNDRTVDDDRHGACANDELSGTQVDDARRKQETLTPAIFQCGGAGTKRYRRVRFGAGDLWGNPQGLLKTQGAHQMAGSIHDDDGSLHP